MGDKKIENCRSSNQIIHTKTNKKKQTHITVYANLKEVIYYCGFKMNYNQKLYMNK